jgi:FKBP-type peptidyl-prolyl cis-trans isomerase SlpA
MRRAAGLILALAVLPAAACRRDGRVRSGDAVALHYEMSVDGAVRESTFGGRPVEIVQGAGDVPPGVDAALIAMAPGTEKRLELTPETGFGPRDPARVQALPLKDFGALAAGLKPGQKVSGFRDGKAETGVVLSMGGGEVVLDFNHPLAGKAVSYRVRVVSTGAAR